MNVNTDRNRQLIRRWLEFGEGGFDGDFGEFISADYTGHTGGAADMDRAELERLERGFAAAFGDVRYAIQDLIAEDDRVVLRVETSAIHRGPYIGIPPTARRVKLTGIVIYRIADGKIAESWAELDFAHLIRQLR